MSFWTGPTYRLVEAMRAAGNQPGVIEWWRAMMEQWAKANPTHPDAAALAAWLPLWKPRPFYTALELTPMFPALAVMLGYAQRMERCRKSPAQLANELRAARCPTRRVRGVEYFIVERFGYWTNAETEKFEELLS